MPESGAQEAAARTNLRHPPHLVVMEHWAGKENVDGLVLDPCLGLVVHLSHRPWFILISLSVGVLVFFLSLCFIAWSQRAAFVVSFHFSPDLKKRKAEKIPLPPLSKHQSLTDPIIAVNHGSGSAQSIFHLFLSPPSRTAVPKHWLLNKILIALHAHVFLSFYVSIFISHQTSRGNTTCTYCVFSFSTLSLSHSSNSAWPPQ